MNDRRAQSKRQRCKHFLVGATNLLLGQNQIQEATVVSIGYSGQFGGAAGGNGGAGAAES